MLCLITSTRRLSSPRRLLCWRTEPSNQVEQTLVALVADCATVCSGMAAFGKKKPETIREQDLKMVVEKTKALWDGRHAVSSNDVKNFEGHEQADKWARLTAKEAAFREIEVNEEVATVKWCRLLAKYTVKALESFCSQSSSREFYRCETGCVRQLCSGQPPLHWKGRQGPSAC